MNKIDILVTWVEEADATWRESFNYYKQLELTSGAQQETNRQAFDPARTRDWGIFKYWFRAVEKNCPWVRKVFLVVQKDSQIPGWLDRKNPKLRIVCHDEFIPKEFLPTFNSTVIQAFLSNIKDLSEYYIRSDDDCYFLNVINESVFMRNGKPVQYAVQEALDPVPVYNGFSKALNNAVAAFKSLGHSHKYKYSHLQELRSKSIEHKFLAAHKALLYTSLAGSRFRSDKNICAEQLYLWLFKESGLGVIDNTVFDTSTAVFLSGDEDFAAYKNYDMICFNDGEDTKNITACRARLIAFLDKKFPEASSFELQVKEKAEAWLVFISTDTYLYYVLNLYRCLTDSHTKYPLYCGVTKTVSQKSIDILKKVGVNVLILDTEDIERSELIQKDARFGMSQRYINALTKLDLIKAGEARFDKVVYLDSDLHIFENIDELFEYPHMAAVEDIAPAVAHTSYTVGTSIFCSGLFVWDYQENSGLIQAIIDNLDRLPKEVRQWHDQNILNYYYQDWKDQLELHLSPTYGLMLNARAMRMFPGQPKIRHFVQSGKEQIPFMRMTYLNLHGPQHVAVSEYYRAVADTVESYRKKYNIALEPVHLENINMPSAELVWQTMRELAASEGPQKPLSPAHRPQAAFDDGWY